MSTLSRIWCWLLLLGLFTSINVYLFSPWVTEFLSYDQRRLVEAALLAISAVFIVIDRDSTKGWLLTFNRLSWLSRSLWAGFFVLGICASLTAALPVYAMMQVGWYFLLFSLGLQLANARRQFGARFDVMLTATLCISIGCYLIFAFYTYLFNFHAYVHATVAYDSLLASPGFLNPRFLMQFMTWSLPFIALPILLYRKQLRYWTWIWGLLAAYFWCLAFANNSRVFYVEILVVAASALLLFGRAAWPWLKVQAILLVSGLVIYLLLFKFALLVGNRFDIHHLFQEFSALNGRQILWHTAWILFLQHPWLGIGPLHYPYYAYAYEQINAHPHNLWILIGTEWGSLALCILLAISLKGSLRWCQLMRQHASPYLIALSMSFIAALVDSLVSGVMVMPLSQIMQAIVLGWMLGYAHILSPQPDPRISTWHRSGLKVLIILGLLAAGIGFVRTLPMLPHEIMIVLTHCHGQQCILNPNFWAQGWIQFYP